MLNGPAGDSFDLLIVAGEASGDEHAARLLGDLRLRESTHHAPRPLTREQRRRGVLRPR